PCVEAGWCAAGLLHFARRSLPKEDAMAETARMAVFHGAGKPFEIREYPVPDPEPGAALIKVALANVCGSDLHYWRGELDYAKMGRPASTALSPRSTPASTSPASGPGRPLSSRARAASASTRAPWRAKWGRAA